jgi:8-hydroxy-5-deazaflavin:NADPH oxidoreductase
VRVAVVGGTGPFGRALAKRLHEAGHDVVVGSRERGRAEDIAAELGVKGAENADAVRSVELVVLATNADGVIDTGRVLRAEIARTPVLCVASELRFTSTGVHPGEGARALAERLQDELDGPVVAGLHSLAAATLGKDRPDEDALVCGDDADAKALALELAAGLVAGRALDAGPLASARALEGMTAVIVNLNKRYRGHAGIRVTGLP